MSVFNTFCIQITLHQPEIKQKKLFKISWKIIEFIAKYWKMRKIIYLLKRLTRCLDEPENSTFYNHARTKCIQNNYISTKIKENKKSKK